jgi:hypothetical protein
MHYIHNYYIHMYGAGRRRPEPRCYIPLNQNIPKLCLADGTASRIQIAPFGDNTPAITILANRIYAPDTKLHAMRTLRVV